MSNIKLFDTYAAEIFGILYENFPVCVDLKPHEIVARTGDGMAKCAAGDIPRKEREVCSSALHWLRDNELISMHYPSRKRFTTSDNVVTDELFSCVVLTAKGLATLKQTPRSIGGENSLGDEIAQAIKNGMISKAGELASLALTSIVTGYTA